MDKQEEYSEKYDMYVQDGRSRFRQIDREASLIHLMRVNLLKRMEISIFSFGITITKLLSQVNILLEKIESGVSVIDESLDIRDINIVLHGRCIRNGNPLNGPDTKPIHSIINFTFIFIPTRYN